MNPPCQYVDEPYFTCKVPDVGDCMACEDAYNNALSECSGQSLWLSDFNCVEDSACGVPVLGYDCISYSEGGYNDDNVSIDNADFSGTITDANGSVSTINLELPDFSGGFNNLNKLMQDQYNQGVSTNLMLSDYIRNSQNTDQAVLSKLDDIKDSIDNKEIEVNIDLNETNDKLDEINANLGGVINGLKDINDTLKGDGSTGYFDDIQETVEMLHTSYDQTKENYESLVEMVENGFEQPEISGSEASPFQLEVWNGQVIEVDLCPMLSVIRPIMSFIIQLAFMIASVKIVMYTFRPSV
jgi:hypothetical protein